MKKLSPSDTQTIMKFILLHIFLLITSFSVLAQGVKPPIAESISIKRNEEKSRIEVRWKKVPEATKYLISVYSRSNYFSTPSYLNGIEKREVKATATAIPLAVIQANEQYYIRLYSVSGDAVSDATEEVPLLWEETDYRFLSPISNAPECNLTDNKYNLLWAIDNHAAFYNVNGYVKEVFESAGEFVFYEDFNGINIGNRDEPIEVSNATKISIDDFCKVKGWGGAPLSVAQGGVLLSNRYASFGIWSYFDLPNMTLGNDNGEGQFTIQIKVEASAGDTLVVNLYDEKLGRNNHVDLLETKKEELSQNEQIISFNFIKGTPSCFLSLEVHNPKHQAVVPFIDEIRIKRTMKAGDYMRLLMFKQTTNTHSLIINPSTIAVEERKNLQQIVFTVSSGFIRQKRIFSPESPEVIAKSIADCYEALETNQKLRYYLFENELIVQEVSNNCLVQLFSLEGKCVATRIGSGALSFEKLSGFFILKAGSQSKLILL